MPRPAPAENLLEVILRAENMDYAVFDGEGQLHSASAGLEDRLARRVSSGEPLETVFPELTGMFPDLQNALARGEDFQVAHIARPDWNGGSGYMSLQFLAWQGNVLALVKDTSALGSLEQRLTQQRNELALLTAKLERTQAHLLDITTRFLPGKVFASLLDDGRTPVIGGERREVTVLFADLRGFSVWSQGQPPETVFDSLNRLLAEAVRVVLAWDGTLDKFMGDGIMVLFNAPHDQPDHVQRAAHCALELSRLALPGGDLRFGVGLHSGLVMAGYVGAAQAMNYTALGDSVNFAKRIEEIAGPGEVLISESVAPHLEFPFTATFQRALPWGGQTQLIPLYRLGTL